MSRGAVVMMDALGFKGVWRRAEPQRILTKMHSMREHAEDALKKLSGPGSLVASARSAFLSDTIVIGIAPHAGFKDTDMSGAITLLLASYRSGLLLNLAAMDEPRFAYRGCIAFGTFEIDGPFLMGDAVDQAAEHYELAEGALVWLTPSARAVWEARRLHFDPPDTTLVPYDVPLKGGSYRTYVVSPHADEDTPEKKRSVAQNILSTFDGENARRSLQVQIKRQHTERWLLWLDEPGHQRGRHGGPWVDVGEDVAAVIDR